MLSPVVRLKRQTYVRDARRTDKATIVSKMGFIVVLQLFQNPHLAQNIDCRGADSISTVLISWKVSLVK